MWLMWSGRLLFKTATETTRIMHWLKRLNKTGRKASERPVAVALLTEHQHKNEWLKNWSRNVASNASSWRWALKCCDLVFYALFTWSSRNRWKGSGQLYEGGADCRAFCVKMNDGDSWFLSLDLGSCRRLECIQFAAKLTRVFTFARKRNYRRHTGAENLNVIGVWSLGLTRYCPKVKCNHIGLKRNWPRTRVHRQRQLVSMDSGNGYADFLI